jgi:hypothetical protein
VNFLPVHGSVSDVRYGISVTTIERNEPSLFHLLMFYCHKGKGVPENWRLPLGVKCFALAAIKVMRVSLGMKDECPVFMVYCSCCAFCRCDVASWPESQDGSLGIPVARLH